MTKKIEIKSVLLKGELKKLLRVKTTKAWAKKIKSRNVPMLKFLNDLPTTWKDYGNYDGSGSYLGELGCPHCIECDGNCDECLWLNYDEKLGECEPCSQAKFGRVTHKEIMYLDSFLHPILSLHYYIDEEEIRMSLDICKRDFPLYLKRLEKCKTFVKGHIEWAEAIINGAKND